MIKYNNSNINEWNFGSDNIAKVYYGVQGSQPRLPSGYTEVEYVENQDMACINTEFKPNQDTRIIAEMQTVASTSYVNHFGAGGWNEPNALILDYENNYNGTIHLTWGTATGWTVVSSVIGDYSKHTYDWNKNEVYRDNTLVKAFTYGNYQAESNLYIFTTPNNGSSTPPSSQVYYMKGKMYSFKIYDDGTLVRDFVPCTRNSDGKVGVYDLVGGQFYSSANSGYELVAGSAVSPSSMSGRLVYQKITNGSTPPTPPTPVIPSGYTEVEYIENTGTTSSNGAYLNLGLPLYNTIGNSFVITSRLKSEYYSASGYNDLETIINSEGVSSPYYGFVYRYAHSNHNIELVSNPSNHATLSTTANTDGTTSITINCNSTTVTDQVPLGLFASYNANYNTPYRFAKATIYSLTVVKNGDTVRDLVPAKRDSDSKYGLYDLVTDTFYVSPNGNNFSGGNPV